MSEPIHSLRDVEVRLGRLRQEWDSFVSGNYDRHGLRLINNGRSADSKDYVIRDEVNDLIRDALLNLDKLAVSEITNIFNTTQGLQNPLIESIRASLDNTYDIGEAGSGNRIRWGFADIWNAETLEITDPASHTSHWKLAQNTVTLLDLRDAGNALIFRFASVSAGASASFNHILPSASNTLDLGSANTLWKDLFSVSLTLGKSTVTRLQGVLNIANANNSTVFSMSGFTGGHVKVIGSFIPNVDNTYDFGTDLLRWANLYGTNLTLGKSTVTRIQGFLNIANDVDSTVFQMSGTANGYANVPANRQLRFEDSGAVNRAIIGVSSDEGFVNCNASGGNVLLVTSATAGNNSVWINSIKILGPQGAAVADVAGTAGASYTSTEQGIINSLVAQLNLLLARQRAHGIIAT